ncbi:MAG: hypothetical protein II235_04620 [Muribaculaceae bacterium]|nr:hypothetical protein [Muribaculaceae bacterium]
MEESLEMKELQELREQFCLINEKLEKQVIINEALIKESMKKKLSYINRTYKMYVWALVITTPLLIALLALHKASLGLWIFIVVALLVEFFLNSRLYRKLNTKDLMSLGHVEAVERVAVFKKNYKKITIAMLVPAMVLFVSFIGLVSDYRFDMGTVIYYSIFIVIALTYEFVRSKKMFLKLDSVLKQIKELRGE